MTTTTAQKTQVASVLIAEDDAMVRGVAGRILEQSGFTVTAVTGGRDALDRLCTDDHGFDVVLLDLWMPDMNGGDVLNELRARGMPAPPVIISSGDAAPDSAALREAGVTGFVEKPYRFDHLIAVLRSAIS